MESWNKIDARRNPGRHGAPAGRVPVQNAVRFRRVGAGASRRDGKIALVTLFAVLGLVVMIGFVGNAGHIVSTKVATQNTADVVAFSSAQWMARGMNAVTATNHLLGEATALVTIMGALGGPEVDAAIKDYPLQSKTMDNVIRSVASKAPIRGLTTYGVTPFVTNADQKLIDFVVNAVAPKDSQKAEHEAFATIYDSKMTLKRDVAKWLTIKTAANVGLFVPPPWGYISAAVAWGVHLKADYELVQIGKEWYILEGLELIAVNMKPFKVDILEKQLIPALVVHGDYIAGRLGEKNAGGSGNGATNQNGKDALKPGIVNSALTDSLQHLNKVYNMKASTFPSTTAFRLPIAREPGASLTSGPNEPEWGTDEPPRTAADEQLDKLNGDIAKRKRKIRRRIAQLQVDLRKIDQLEADINELDQDENTTAAERRELNLERVELRRVRAEKQADLAEARQKLAKLEQEQGDINSTLESLAELPPGNGNLSPLHLPDRLNQAEERYTQWVRATFPYVDAYRAPILGKFDDWLERSKASEHYTKWTNRYTLVYAWQFRSGYRFVAAENKKRGQWIAPDGNRNKAEPLHMYAMKDAFASSGQRRDRKGHEKWTTNTADGKQEAEKMFTVLGVVHRQVEPLFSPSVFPVASDQGMTTFAQAIFYNGNEQQPAAIGAQEKTQAKLGWDTLNWDPATATPEWGSEPSKAPGKWPWEIFKGASELGTARVKLNWQAKLMPVTSGRLTGAVTNPPTPQALQNLIMAGVAHGKLVTH